MSVARGLFNFLLSRVTAPGYHFAGQDGTAINLDEGFERFAGGSGIAGGSANTLVRLHLRRSE